MSESNPYSAIVCGIMTENGLVTQSGAERVSTWEIVINIGATDGVQIGQNFVIFSLGPEIFDPQTKETLGYFEIVRGKAKATHVQERMATLRSTNTTLVRRYEKNALLAFTGDTLNEMRQEPIPIKGIDIGDFVRRV